MATRAETLAQFISDNQFHKVAEIGVGTGDTMRHILDQCPLLEEYVAVDIDLGSVRTYTDMEKCKLLEMTSVEAAKQVADGSLDLVFIDAGHGYPLVKTDIAVWQSKVRSGGILCGHDYWQGHSHPLPAVDGVKQAVDEVFGGRVSLECDTATHKDCHVWSVRI